MTTEELEDIGINAVTLLKERNFGQLAKLFGYALKFDRKASNAIKEDFEVELEGTFGNFIDAESKVTVKKLEPNNTGLSYLIECDLQMENSTGVLMELILNSKGTVYLEQISSYRTELNA